MTKYNKKNNMNRNRSLGLSNDNNRNNSRGNNANSNSNIQMGLMRMSDFDDFDRMFEDFGMPRLRFGGMEDFFGGSSGVRSRFDGVERNIFTNFESMSSGNMPGTVITKSYVSKVNYDSNGQPHKETYQAQSIKQTDKEGKKIQEKQQAYQNTHTGVQKAANERLLNDKGHKIVKARNRNTGEELEHNYFKGMQEEELNNFNNEYNEQRQKSKFENNYKFLNGGNNNNRRGLPDSNSRLNNNRGENPPSNQHKALPDNYQSRR